MHKDAPLSSTSCSPDKNIMSYMHISRFLANLHLKRSRIERNHISGVEAYAVTRYMFKRYFVSAAIMLDNSVLIKHEQFCRGISASLSKAILPLFLSSFLLSSLLCCSAIIRNSSLSLIYYSFRWPRNRVPCS